LLLAPSPVTHAVVSGPYGLYYFISLTGYNPIDPYQSYPGGTVYLNYWLVDSSTSSSDTLTAIGLTTPWQTYSDASVPVTIPQGESYYGYFTITIPSGQQPGNVTWTFTESATGYTSISRSFTFTIYTNPAALQSQINTLNAQISTLQGQVTSLQTQLTSAQNSAASLQSTVTSLQGQVTSLQSQLTAAQNNATSLKSSVNSLTSQLTTASSQLSLTQSQLVNETAKANALTSQLQSAQSNIANVTAQVNSLTSQLSSAKDSLSAANANLTSVQGQLAATRSELGTYSSVYLPAGVGVPLIVAILFLVLYLRKGPRTSASPGVLQPKASSAVAPSGGTQPTSRFCSNCGTENKLGARFCSKCGAGLQ